MKSLIIIISLALLIGLSTQDQCPNCSISNFQSVENLDLSRMEGCWYTYSRYPNGNRADTICGLFTFTATKKKSVLDLVFKFYWSKTDENDVTYEPKSTVNFIDNSGTFYIPGWLPVWTVFIVWTDYENIAVFRACLNSEEYMWIDTRELNPSAKVVKKIKKIIEDYDFDKSKIVRVCTGVKYEFNLD